MYDGRLIDRLIRDCLAELPAILVEGAKAVGKTRTCSNIAKTVYTLDKDADRELLTADPSVILSETPPVLLDEWQLAPELWSFVRHAVDDGLHAGAVLFTGSSTKVNAKIHSGAGRILRVKMRPYTIEERQMSGEYIRVSDLLAANKALKVQGKTDKLIGDYLDEIFRSGFPGIRGQSERARKLLLQSYVANIIEHEFEENGFQVKKPESLRAWLMAYAACIATPAKYQAILDASMANNLETPSRPTANNYRDALSILHIVDEVPAFAAMGKLLPNLAKAPKHFLMDAAIAIALLSVSRDELTTVERPKAIGKFNKTFVGQLFESFVCQSLIVYAELNDAELSHFRLASGTREIDFIIKKGRKLLLTEVKASASVSEDDARHLNWFEAEAMGEYEITKVLVYAGPFAYTRNDGVHVIPASMLGV
ncbi:MAG: DUF4143 domain-containing protein [Clostridiales Family XIII bacterium]|nr:DUF4143 domain-containing protein [Clostridiales Family XIII bacterium]